MHAPQRVEHTLPAIVPENASILILGSMPSPKSREANLYYGNAQNRFWPVLCAVYGESERPRTLEAAGAFAARHGFALWDVLASCEIAGASDASIRNPAANDIAGLLQRSGIQKIFTTGQTAYRLYKKYCQPATFLPAIPLPSTSPANCRVSTEELIAAYQILRRG